MCVMSGVNCFGIPDTYRGRDIRQGPNDQFYAAAPELSARTWDDLRDVIDAEPASTSELIAALHQYRDDMRYPPAADSRERRIAMIDALIAKASPDTLGACADQRVAAQS
jgi:hypothetical protein